MITTNTTTTTSSTVLGSRPGEPSAKTARQAGAPNTLMSGENPMLTTTTSLSRPRVWLVAGLNPQQSGHDRPPADLPTVRDDRCRCWTPGPDGRWHTPDNRHHATWDELHTRTDLVEVTAPAGRADRDLGDWDGTENTPAGGVAA